MKNCAKDYAKLEDLLGGENPPQKPLHELMRSIADTTSSKGYAPTGFRRALGGAEIVWESCEWTYTLGVTTGVPNVGDTRSYHAFPVPLVSLLREHFPTLMTDTSRAETTNMRKQGVSQKVADQCLELMSAMAWIQSSERFFWAIDDSGEVELTASDRGHDHAILEVYEAGIHVHQDFGGKLTMLCKALGLQLAE